MRRVFAAGCLSLLIAVLGVVAPASVAHAQQACDPNGPLADMAGTYASTDAQMRVEIYPCNGVYVQWSNAYGTHAAAYSGTAYLAGGGFIADGRLPDSAVGYPDSASRIILKPAEAGFIQAITSGPYDEVYRAYRLRKMV